MLFIVEFVLSMVLAMFLFGWFCFTLLALVAFLYDQQPENGIEATSGALRGLPKSLVLGLVLTVLYPIG